MIWGKNEPDKNQDLLFVIYDFSQIKIVINSKSLRNTDSCILKYLDLAKKKNYKYVRAVRHLKIMPRSRNSKVYITISVEVVCDSEIW